MLDEPLGALDRSLRREPARRAGGDLPELTLPIVYVTHDQEEALAIGDRVAVMRAGRLEAVRPARPVAQAAERVRGAIPGLHQHR